MKVKLRDVYEVPAVFGRTSDPHQQYLLSIHLFFGPPWFSGHNGPGFQMHCGSCILDEGRHRVGVPR